MHACQTPSTALAGDQALTAEVLAYPQAGHTALADAYGSAGSVLRLSLRSPVEAGQASGVLSAQLLFRDDQIAPSALQKVCQGSSPEPHLG